MTRREPPGVAILAARLARAYPALSVFSAASLAVELLGIKRAQRRLAERACADSDYAIGAAGPIAVTNVPEAWAGNRARARITKAVGAWRFRLERDAGVSSGATVGMLSRKLDPRGPVLLLRLPGEAEAVAV